MLEKTVEAYLVERVRALGGIAYKFTSPARASVPDRIVILPSGRAFIADTFARGRIYLIEVKRPGGKLTRGQEREHERLRRLGADVRVLDSIGAINAFLNEVETAPAVPGHVRFSMESTARWLEGGCDPLAAAKEIRACLAKVDAAPAAPVASPSIDIEQMLRDCVPGGDIVDPQLVCDNIRGWFADHAQAVAADGAAIDTKAIAESLERMIVDWYADCERTRLDWKQMAGVIKLRLDRFLKRAAVSPATADERAAFEAWARKQPKHIIKDLQRYDDNHPDKSIAGEYGHCSTKDAWFIWQAARASQAAAPASKTLSCMQDEIAGVMQQAAAPALVPPFKRYNWDGKESEAGPLVFFLDVLEALKIVEDEQAAAPAEAREHVDDVAVDEFAIAMKAKMASARAKGRSGWETCAPAELSRMLREHVEKGDPRDVANFCMMLHHHGAPIGGAADAGEAVAQGAQGGKGGEA